MTAPQFREGTYHCALFSADDHGAPLRSFKECKLHPGHVKFMTVDEFENKKETPWKLGLRKEDMPIVRNVIERTVLVRVNHTSTRRPDTYNNSETPYPCNELRGCCNRIRYGTGYLVGIYNLCTEEPCSCTECKTSTCQIPNRASYYFVIKTATHVIFDKEEAQNTTFVFFYDSEDRSNVKNIYGVTVLGSEPLRLETDRCFVMCVTHDGDFAKELGLLCHHDVPFPVQNVLVSHPHGVSKRISIGNDPERTILINPNKTSVKLKKGTKIRLSCFHDAPYVANDLEDLLESPVKFNEDEDLSNIRLLRCDVTVYRREGVIVETSGDDLWDYKILDEKEDVWWDMLTPDTQLVTDDEKRYSFPYNDDEESPLTVKGKIKTFFDDKDKLSVFFYVRHNMASCPGSSGAHVKTFNDYYIHSRTGGVHFGHSKSFNTSGLFCVYTPHNEHDSKTNLNNISTDTEHWLQRPTFYDIVSETEDEIQLNQKRLNRKRLKQKQSIKERVLE